MDMFYLNASFVAPFTILKTAVSVELESNMT